jgi:hypothetical protein
VSFDYLLYKHNFLIRQGNSTHYFNTDKLRSQIKIIVQSVSHSQSLSVSPSVRTYKPRGTCVTWRTIGNSKLALILFIPFLLVCLFFKPCVAKNG